MVVRSSDVCARVRAARRALEAVCITLTLESGSENSEDQGCANTKNAQKHGDVLEVYTNS